MGAISIIVALLSISLVAVLASFVAQRIAKNIKKRKAALQEIYLKKIYDEWNEYYEQLEPGLKDAAMETLETYLALRLLPTYAESWRKLPVDFSIYSTKDEVENEVNRKIDELKKRVEEIEKRFPKKATLEKIASVNDAILSTNLEGLSESIKRIEEKMLTRWDVAKIVFEILAALAFLTGLIFGALKFLSGI